jgi:hypothetical protein
MKTTDLAPQKIVHLAAQRARGLDRVEPLVQELERYDALGNAAMAGETVRTLDDLAGFYVDGKFVGGRQIARALRQTQGRAKCEK